MKPKLDCPKCNKEPRRSPGELGKSCHAAAERARRAAERDRREASDYEALKPSDFTAGVGRGVPDTNADREKKQEYALQMGEYADFLHTGNGDPKLGAYMARLAEEERRFGNRRLARSVSLASAHEALSLRRFMQAAREHFSGRITPSGYALRGARPDLKRTVCVLLSDLHFGSDLSPLDNPEPFGAVEEARRFERVVLEVAEYKTRHRDASKLQVLLNGDLIEGLLLHDLRDGAPLTEQFMACLSYLSAAVQLWSSVFPEVHVECQPGNHGRSKLRHPGRATSSKWDGEEWKLYKTLELMCSQLKNVRFSVPFRAVSAVDLHGAKLLLSHGDTEVPVKHPDTGASFNAGELAKINARRVYGVEFQVAAFGHFHTPRLQPRRDVTAIFNGALVPANGHARTMGYTGEPCGQWVWEAVPGHPVGDARFVVVGEGDDRDRSLGRVVKPFRFPVAA